MDICYKCKIHTGFQKLYKHDNMLANFYWLLIEIFLMGQIAKIILPLKNKSFFFLIKYLPENSGFSCDLRILTEHH